MVLFKLLANTIASCSVLLDRIQCLSLHLHYFVLFGLCCWGALPLCFGFIVGEPTPFLFIGSPTSSSFWIRIGKDSSLYPFPYLFRKKKKKSSLNYMNKINNINQLEAEHPRHYAPTCLVATMHLKPERRSLLYSSQVQIVYMVSPSRCWLCGKHNCKSTT
jgi:hypothetical protein